MRDHNINQGSSSSLISIEMEVTAEALNSPLQGKLQAIMILVKDLDLIAGFAEPRRPGVVNAAQRKVRKNNRFVEPDVIGSDDLCSRAVTVKRQYSGRT
jgi:hypothetical protein